MYLKSVYHILERHIGRILHVQIAGCEYIPNGAREGGQGVHGVARIEERIGRFRDGEMDASGDREVQNRCNHNRLAP